MVGAPPASVKRPLRSRRNPGGYVRSSPHIEEVRWIPPALDVPAYSRASAAMCPGPVPQQLPTIVAPASTHVAACAT